MTHDKPLIGFIGQGFIGKNYADDFERRGYIVVRYALEAPYRDNEAKIATCNVVFIAVPTPTTPTGFDSSIVEKSLSLVGVGRIAVIKSTLLPGTTEALQERFPDRIVLHSPEFLSEATAAYDAAHPDRNIVGLTKETSEHRRAAEQVLAILPPAPYAAIVGAKEAEFIKYASNVLGYTLVVFANLIYDMSQAIGADWETIQAAARANSKNLATYMNPVHKSGRGAGGHCFIKDFSAFKSFCEERLNDPQAINVLTALEKKNIELLLKSHKDLELLAGVYGEKIISEPTLS